MSKKLFADRKRVVFYLGRINYLHLVKKAGGSGKISAWIRTLIEKELFQ